MSTYPNQYDSDDSITPYTNNDSSQDEDDIDLDAIENGPMPNNPAPISTSNNDKKRIFSSTNNELNPNLNPSKKQKTTHRTWSCELCTYKNPINNERCSICTSPKPRKNNNNNPIEIDEKSEQKMTDLSNNNSNSNDNNISKLINGLKNVQINANKNGNNTNDMDNVNGIIDKLEGLKFDANANEAIKQNNTMNNIINKLNNLDVNNTNTNDIRSMVSDINNKINEFIIELQSSLYWKSKIKHESKKFSGMPYRSNMDRIIGIMTYYHDNHNEEFNIFSYVNDAESDYKYLANDYKCIVSDNIISNNNIITMKKQFGIFVDYISQMFPICEHNKCDIFDRYCNDKNNNDDDDMFDDKVKHFKQLMDILHCYLFHAEHCGIIVVNDKVYKKNVNSNNFEKKYINLKFGGQWYWFFDDNEIKWVPYNKTDQLKLNNGWRNMNKEVLVGVNNKYKVQFKRESSNIDPFGHQYDRTRNDSFRRAVIYGIRDNNGTINGIPCDQNPMA